MTDDDSGLPNRRTILESIATVAGTVAISGVGEARKADDETRRALQSEYNRPETAHAAIETFGGNILRDLKRRGILETTVTTELVPDDLQSVEAHRDGAEGVFVSGFDFEGEYTARITTTIETDAHTVEMFLHPRVETHYAVVEPTGETRPEFVVEDTGDGVEPREFCQQNGTICKFEANEFGCCPPLFGCTNTEFEKIVCDDGRCYAGSQTGCCFQTKKC